MHEPTILIADDEPDVLDTVGLRLALEDRYEILTATNGIDALGMARLYQPDLILMDVMMPGENGCRVARTIQDDVEKGIYGKRPRIILLTARNLSSEPEREKMFMDFSGADDVVYKPFDLEGLVTSVARHLLLLPSAQGLRTASA